MAANWKIGEDFAIRYGGYRDIQWFKGEGFEELAKSFSPSSSPTETLTFNPVETIIEVSKSAALFLQWWEMRQQTLLQNAAFEERRIFWIADIVAQWFAEVEQGTIRLDTVHYLDRELSRFLLKIQENSLIDAPSTLLLQIERSTNILVGINNDINNLILEQSPNFTLPGADIPQSFDYKPYFLIEQDENQFVEYVNSANKIITTSPPPLFYLGYKGDWKKLVITSAITGLLWTVPKLFELKNKIKSKERLQEFEVIRNFSIELRSTNTLLRLLQELPLSLKTFNAEQLQSNGKGKLLLISDRSTQNSEDM